jgi:hypothetical protein
MKVSATRPSTNSFWFEVQFQSMKRKIKISTHVNQALVSDINKLLELRSAITKNTKNKSKFQLM